MLTLLSPAKSLDFESTSVETFTQPELLDESDRLMAILKEKSHEEVAGLMSLSAKLAELNVDRFQSYERPFVLNHGAKQALLAFTGDVYRDWPLESYDAADFAYAQDHLRILSGLYGALRPLDLIRPYRLEMGTRLSNERGKNLYEFWGARITQSLNETLSASGSEFVVNLASNEYFSSVKKRELEGTLVSPVFKDWKNGKYKIISFFAKRARGAMAHYLLKNRIVDLDGLRAFDVDGYGLHEESSTPTTPVFLRRQD